MVWDIAGPNTNRFQSKNFLSNIDDFQMEMEKEIKVRGGIFSYKSRNLWTKKQEIHSISKALMQDYLSIKIIKFKWKNKNNKIEVKKVRSMCK